jgi:hypothetical protein
VGLVFSSLRVALHTPPPIQINKQPLKKMGYFLNEQGQRSGKKVKMIALCIWCTWFDLNPELELELIQTQMTQKPVLQTLASRTCGCPGATPGCRRKTCRSLWRKAPPKSGSAA